MGSSKSLRTRSREAMYGSLQLTTTEHRKAHSTKRLSDMSHLTSFQSARRLRQRGGGVGGQRRGTVPSTFETVVRSVRSIRSLPPATADNTDNTNNTTTYSFQPVGGKLKAPSRRKHSRLYDILSPKSIHPFAGIFKRFITIIIVVDLAFFIMSTDPQLQNKQRLFYIVEGVTSSIFLIEYLARFITCTEARKYNKRGPVLGRLSYMLSTHALVDAFATFPFFLELLVQDLKLPTLTYLRVFRLLRITKTLAYSRAFRSVNRVVYYNREILYVAILLCAFLILFTSFIMYYLRPPDNMRLPGDSEFDSIPATMYLSALMLSGQGGPTGDLPWYTKFVVLMTSFFSVAMFAIPASMFTWGFEAEAERLAAKSYRRKKTCGSSGSSDDESSSSSENEEEYGGGESGYWSEDESACSIDSSDEEYERIIAGEGDDDSSSDDDDDDDDVKMLDPKKQNLKVLVSQLSQRLLSVEKSFHSSSRDGGESSPLLRLSTIQSSMTEDGEALVESVRRLEEKVDATTEKLDRLLEVMEKKGLFRDEENSNI